ncbi:MAG: lipase [Leptolyngbyaceae cyanobacterium SL_7_1]|nr:lipase [Leptolyngbyaceae cyanobacterium SL_7_1]
MTDIRICFVGDSFVNGTGDPECLGWSGRLCASQCRQGRAITYYNLGVRRETSADIRDRWFKEVSCRLPAPEGGRVVFSFGTNDTTLESQGTRVKLADSIKNTHTILSLAIQHYPVLMISPPPIADDAQNSRTADLVTHFAQLCYELTVPYLNVFAPLQQSAVWQREVQTGDGAHPAAAGYATLASMIEEWADWKAWF